MQKDLILEKIILIDEFNISENDIKRLISDCLNDTDNSLFENS